MKFLCATDFSVHAGHGADAAVSIAERFQADVTLAHAVNVPAGRLLPAPIRETWTAEARAALRQLAGKVVRRDHDVATELLIGVPDEAIVQYAQSHQPQLIVMGALGERDAGEWIIGSTAERVADASPVPVLAVRDAAPFRRWAKDEAPLKVFFAYNFDATSDLALGALAQWSRAGRLAVTVAHVNWPRSEHSRLGIRGESVEDNDPVVQRVLERDLRARVKEHYGAAEVDVRVRAAAGRTEDALLEMIHEAEPDLVVCGTHQRSGIARFWRGSVSLELARRCGRNVLLLPAATDSAPRLRSHHAVLAATDFSDAGDEAVARGYALLPHGGTLYLLHVTPPHTGAAPIGPNFESLVFTREEHLQQLRVLKERLRGIIPPEAARAGIRTEFELVEESDVAAAICQAAERLGADAITIGAGTGGVVHRLLEGSVTEAVLEQASRPVMVVKPPVP